MLTWTFILFGIAAAGGIVLGVRALQGKELPMPLAMLHGLLAASGLVLLIVVLLGRESMGMAGWSLGLFIVAALGGFGLFSFHLRKQPHPKALVVVHGLAAVTAFLILLVWAL